jgi:hypothetical protein
MELNSAHAVLAIRKVQHYKLSRQRNTGNRGTVCQLKASEQPNDADKDRDALGQ